MGEEKIDFSGVKKSCVITVGGRSDSFSTRNDYLDFLAGKNIVNSWGDIQSIPNLAEAVYRHWQTQGQLACKFAQHMARDAETHNLRSHMVKTDTEGRCVSGEHERILHTFQACVEDPKTEALALLFPRIDNAAALVMLLKSLSQLTGWKVKAKNNPSDIQARYYISIHVDVGPSIAEALGFGPFDFLPFTRQAPIVAIEFRTKTTNPKTSSLPFPDADRLHLAGIPFTGTEVIYRKKLALTEQFRAEYLGGDDSAAKAKVAFAIPRRDWENN